MNELLTNINDIFWQQTSLIVLCSSTVKEPVSSRIRVYPLHSITESINMVAKCIVDMYITAELKAYWLSY